MTQGDQKKQKEKMTRVKPKDLLEAYQKKATEEIFELPALENHVVDLSMLTPEMAVIKAKELREKEVPKLEEDVKKALTWLDFFAKAGRDEREVMEFAVKRSGKKHPSQWLQENLSNEYAGYRRATWTTLLNYYFSKEVKSREEVQAILNFLCQQGYLSENPEGPFKAYGKGYALPEKAATVLTGEPELSLLMRALGELLWRARQAERKGAEERGKTLLSQGKLTWKEFLEGKVGLFALEVPAEREGHRGGTLLVESDGRKVFPLEGVGGFREAIEEAKKLEVFLLLPSLSWNNPPFIKGVEAQKGAKVTLLWHLLKSGISQLEEKEKIQAVREEMKVTANLITPEEFFLDKKPGITFSEYEGTWIWKNISEGEAKETHQENLFFLVERQEKEGQPIIRLVRIPPWLKEFFSNCQGEFKEGEGFGGIPQPLQSVLRRIWGQVRKHFQIQNHTA